MDTGSNRNLVAVGVYMYGCVCVRVGEKNIATFARGGPAESWWRSDRFSGCPLSYLLGREAGSLRGFAQRKMAQNMLFRYTHDNIFYTLDVSARD